MYKRIVMSMACDLLGMHRLADHIDHDDHYWLSAFDDDSSGWVTENNNHSSSSDVGKHKLKLSEDETLDHYVPKGKDFLKGLSISDRGELAPPGGKLSTRYHSFFVDPDGTTVGLSSHHREAMKDYIHQLINHHQCDSPNCVDPASLEYLFSYGTYEFANKIIPGILRIYAYGSLNLTSITGINLNQFRVIEKIISMYPAFRRVAIDNGGRVWIEGKIEDIKKLVGEFNVKVNAPQIELHRLLELEQFKALRNYMPTQSPSVREFTKSLPKIPNHVLKNILNDLRNKPIRVERHYKDRKYAQKADKDIENEIKELIPDPEVFYQNIINATGGRFLTPLDLHLPSWYNSFFILKDGRILSLGRYHHYDALNLAIGKFYSERAFLIFDSMSEYKFASIAGNGMARVFMGTRACYINSRDALNSKQIDAIHNLIKTNFPRADIVKIEDLSSNPSLGTGKTISGAAAQFNNIIEEKNKNNNVSELNERNLELLQFRDLLDQNNSEKDFQDTSFVNKLPNISKKERDEILSKIKHKPTTVEKNYYSNAYASVKFIDVMNQFDSVGMYRDADNLFRIVTSELYDELVKERNIDPEKFYNQIIESSNGGFFISPDDKDLATRTEGISSFFITKDGRIIGFWGHHKRLLESLSEKFNYSDLMAQSPSIYRFSQLAGGGMIRVFFDSYKTVSGKYRTRGNVTSTSAISSELQISALYKLCTLKNVGYISIDHDSANIMSTGPDIYSVVKDFNKKMHKKEQRDLQNLNQDRMRELDQFNKIRQDEGDLETLDYDNSNNPKGIPNPLRNQIIDTLNKKEYPIPAELNNKRNIGASK